MEMVKHFHLFCNSGICNSYKMLLEANTIMPKSFVFEEALIGKFYIGYVIYRRLTSYCRYSKPLKTWKWQSTATHFASLASAIPIRSFWKQTP
nr:hypothetical protein CFP56_17109 [Quercus suber]